MTIFDEDKPLQDEDLDAIKRDFIEAKKQGIIGGYEVEFPYIIGQFGEVKERVYVDIQPDFESKRAKLVFSDNFGEQHCVHYIPIIRHKYLDKWQIEAFYPVDKYGEQIPLVNRYLSDIGCTNINEGTFVKSQETAEALNVVPNERVIKLCDNNNGVINLNDNEDILNSIIEADEAGETLTLELPNDEDYTRTSISISPRLQFWGADIRLSDNIISNPKRYYPGFKAIMSYLQYKVGVTNFNLLNTTGEFVKLTDQSYFQKASKNDIQIGGTEIQF